MFLAINVSQPNIGWSFAPPRLKNVEQALKSRMNFIVQYRQGSFWREFRCPSIDEAILAAGRMLSVDGCSEFQIVGGDGQLLLDQSEIVERHTHIRGDGDEPSPEAA